MTLVQATVEAIGPCCARHGIRSVAVPPLGCGLGGLDWTDVRALLLDAAARHPELRWRLYEPAQGPEPWTTMRNITPPPAITPRYKLPLPAIDVPFSALGGAWRMLPMERGPNPS